MQHQFHTIGDAQFVEDVTVDKSIRSFCRYRKESIDMANREIALQLNLSEPMNNQLHGIIALAWLESVLSFPLASTAVAT